MYPALGDTVLYLMMMIMMKTKTRKFKSQEKIDLQGFRKHKNMLSSIEVEGQSQHTGLSFVLPYNNDKIVLLILVRYNVLNKR